MPARHPVLKLGVNEKRLKNLLVHADEQSLQEFETLLGLAGVVSAFDDIARLVQQELFLCGKVPILDGPFGQVSAQVSGVST